MPKESPAPSHSFDDLNRSVAALVHEGSPAISALASWALEHPQEMAFHSVRGLSKQSGANANTVYRFALALGFAGFEECRQAFQAAMRRGSGVYGARAAKLKLEGSDDLLESIQQGANRNLDALFSRDNIDRVNDVSRALAASRRVYCVGVRSGFSLAHYLAYTGRLAFENFARPLSEPGAIADALIECTSEDTVVLVTFSLYSAEVVRAHEAALARGAKIISITDVYSSPIARGADHVFCLPMAGPQTLPSHAAGFTLIDMLIATMISQSDTAPSRIALFEDRLVEIGSYLTAPGQSS